MEVNTSIIRPHFTYLSLSLTIFSLNCTLVRMLIHSYTEAWDNQHSTSLDG